MLRKRIEVVDVRTIVGTNAVDGCQFSPFQLLVIKAGNRLHLAIRYP